MNLIISEAEREIFKEILNISLAKAADSFAAIAKEKVLLNAPEVSIVEPEHILDIVPQYEKHTTIIQSNLHGSINGRTYLLFTEEQADKLTEICLGGSVIRKDNSLRLKNSLLLEVGNIITGSLVTQLANILKLDLFGSVPELKNNVIGNVLRGLNHEYPLYKPFVFTVKTQFVYSWKSMEMPFLLIFDLDALVKVLSIIRNNLDKNLLAFTV